MDFRILHDFWPVWVPVVQKNVRQKLWILRHFPLFLNTIQIDKDFNILHNLEDCPFVACVDTNRSS